MPGMFKKAMLYLGLGSDEDFAALDREMVDVGAMAEPDDAAVVQRMGGAPAGARPAPAPDRPVASAVRPLPSEEVRDLQASARPSVVRTIPAPKATKPHIVVPVAFNDAQEVADAFKKNQPVIVNLQQADRDLTRRLIDFASGLCYGVGGTMKKVGDAVYLLTPDDVEVSPEDRKRLEDAGLYDR
jgi:cell division inhibitor SepF